MTVGQRLRRLRIAHNWTITEAAEHFDISPGKVGCWERDLAYPRLPYFRLICTAYGITLSEFFIGVTLPPVDGKRARTIRRRERALAEAAADHGDDTPPPSPAA
jgi:transcriptional regulator with XRE-family HTH domain